MVEEATNVLREWGVIWNQSFVVSIRSLSLSLDGCRYVFCLEKNKNKKENKLARGKRTKLEDEQDLITNNKVLNFECPTVVFCTNSRARH